MGALQRMSGAALLLACVWIVTYWLWDGNGPGQPQTPAITIDETQFYVVQQGDTLGSIAQQLYSDPGQWELLYMANRDVLDTTGAFQTGLRLVVPRAPDGN